MTIEINDDQRRLLLGLLLVNAISDKGPGGPLVADAYGSGKLLVDRLLYDEPASPGPHDLGGCDAV
jgi:hypothetical protein